jgi:hypothetical protein
LAGFSVDGKNSLNSFDFMTPLSVTDGQLAPPRMAPLASSGARAMLLSEFFESIYRPLRLLNRSVRTDQLFRYTIRLFAVTLGRPATLADLSDIVVTPMRIAAEIIFEDRINEH